MQGLCFAPSWLGVDALNPQVLQEQGFARTFHRQAERRIQRVASMIELGRDLYNAIYHAPTERLVLMKRLPDRYPSAAQIERSSEHIALCLRTVDRPSASLLIDGRSAPGNNNPALEPAFIRLHNELVDRFRACAVLVMSAIGVLHVSRLAKGNPTPQRAFTEVDKALLYLGVRVDLVIPP